MVTGTRYGGMEYSDVRERTAGTRRAARPGFEPNASKLRRPLTRPGTIARSSLVGRLTRDDLRPIVSLVAPSGYGKTTLLSQWAEHSGQAFAWVTVDEHDNDPKVLLSYVAEALDRVQPVDERVFEALASPVSSVPGSVVPRLGSAFWSMTVPLVLVLDDVHLLHTTECRDALSLLADHVPGGSRLVLAGRNEPPLRIPRLRAEGRITEIGPGDLSLTKEEAISLLHATGVRLGEDDLTALHQRTEGWPAGLYLAALYLRGGGSPGTAAVSFGGDDWLVSQYMETEFLARVSQRHRMFLTRTAVLDRMCGPLCDAVLELPGSAATLAELSRSNLLLVPLDRRRVWYRFHHLFRDMLLAEMERLEPGLMPVLRRRAARWCLRHGRPEEALEYFMAAGDVDAALRQGIAQLLSGDPEGAETFLEQAISSGEEVGAALRSQLAKESAAGVPGASSLTAAELRVLPLLATHLSFPEIGTEMFLSPHTVKSQAMSIYRKLGASSRHQAVTRARDLGLLEG